MAGGASRSLKLELPAVRQSASRARLAVTEMLEGLNVDVWPVELVVSEAVTNAVLHAYRDREPGGVELDAALDDGVLTLVVADFGIGMSPNPNSPGLGWGLGLIERLVEHMDVQTGGGTRLLVRLRLVPVT